MPDLLALIRRGIRLPPSGWMLAAMLAFYVLAGLFGRDPWKGEDAVHIGTAWHMLHYGDWLSPDLAGRAFHEPPLYYWSAALTGKIFGWLLPLHEAMRIASGIWVTLALMGLYYASRELYGDDSAAASPLLLAGCAGLIFHAHDAQPMLIALAAYSGGLGALAAIGRKPRLTGIFYGLALAGCLLGTGIAPTLPLLALAPVAWWLSPDRPKALHTLLIGLGIAAVLILPWPMLLLSLEPARFHGWLATELAPLNTPFSLSRTRPLHRHDAVVRLPGHAARGLDTVAAPQELTAPPGFAAAGLPRHHATPAGLGLPAARNSRRCCCCRRWPCSPRQAPWPCGAAPPAPSTGSP